MSRHGIQLVREDMLKYSERQHAKVGVLVNILLEIDCCEGADLCPVSGSARAVPFTEGVCVGVRLHGAATVRRPH